MKTLHIYSSSNTALILFYFFFFFFLYIGTVALCILNKIYLTNSSSKTALILFFRDKNKSHMKVTLFGFHLLETHVKRKW